MMTVQMFLFLLTAYSVITGLVVEAIKKIIKEKENFSANLTALITGLVVGFIGTFMYYKLNDYPINANNIIYAILLGGASGLSATLGFDKIKQAIEQIAGK